MSGHHSQLYNKFGSHLVELNGDTGVYFSVYAPAALKVEVIGDFNDWSGHEHQLNVRWDDSGIWEGFIPSLGHGALYKYRIYSHNDREIREKADPFARCNEVPPRSASVVWKTIYNWRDKGWQSLAAEKNNLKSPMCVSKPFL